MKIIIVKNNEEAGVEAAKIIAAQIAIKSNSVLGLATGSTPITTYKNLIKKYNDGILDFKNVTTFNLDEYKGLDGSHTHSYRYFMNDNLFDHVNIDKNKTFVPSGTDTKNPSHYDEMIKQAGGIDLQLLGLGVNGHVGFNEPGTSFDSLTSIVDLAQSTIDVNARFFTSKAEVPTQAISMGLKSIMNAKSVLLIATGTNKAEAIKHLIEGEVSEQWPCTILQKHNNVTIIIDEEAGGLLIK